MNLNKDANLNRIIRRVETRLSNRRRRDDYAWPISHYAETEMEKVIGDYLDATDNLKTQLLKVAAFYVDENYKEIKMNDHTADNV